MRFVSFIKESILFQLFGIFCILLQVLGHWMSTHQHFPYFNINLIIVLIVSTMFGCLVGSGLFLLYQWLSKQSVSIISNKQVNTDR